LYKRSAHKQVAVGYDIRYTSMSGGSYIYEYVEQQDTYR